MFKYYFVITKGISSYEDENKGIIKIQIDK